MNKNNLGEKLLAIFGIISAVLMLADLIIIPTKIDIPVILKRSHYLGYIDFLIILPAIVMMLFVVIINCLTECVIKKELKHIVILQLSIVTIIWCIYLICILFLSFFYNEFGDLVNKIVKYLNPNLY